MDHDKLIIDHDRISDQKIQTNNYIVTGNITLL